MIYVKLPKAINNAVMVSRERAPDSTDLLNLLLDAVVALRAGVDAIDVRRTCPDPWIVECFKAPGVEATVAMFAPGLLETMTLNNINNPYVASYDTRGMFIDNREDFY